MERWEGKEKGGNEELDLEEGSFSRRILRFLRKGGGYIVLLFLYSLMVFFRVLIDSMFKLLVGSFYGEIFYD